MALILANDEKIVKTYQYTQVHKKSGSSTTDNDKSLIVTNKRIIHRIEYKKENGIGVVQDEMPVASAEYISSAYSTVRDPKKLRTALILMFFGIVFAGVAIATDAMMPLMIIAGILLIVGIVFLYLYFKSRLNSVICIISSTDIPNEVMGFSSHTYNSNRKNKKKKNAKKDNKKIIISVDAQIAQDLVNGLGATLQNLKAEAAATANAAAQAPAILESEESPRNRLIAHLSIFFMPQQDFTSN